MLATTGLRLYDRSGRANHGTLTGMDAASDWVTAKVRNTSGRVLDFDGVDDRVVTPSSGSLNPTSAISLASWFRITATPAGVQQAICRKGWSLGTNLQYSVRTIGDKFSGFCVNSSGTIGVATGATGLTANRWYLGVCTYDLENVRVYVDGSLDATTALTGSLAIFSEPLQIAAGFDTNFNSATLFLTGQIAELAIWNRAITASEIRTLYRIGPGWFGKRDSRVFGYSEQLAVSNRRRRILCGDYS